MKAPVTAEDQATEMFAALADAGNGPDPSNSLAGLLFYLTGGNRCSTPASAVLSLAQEHLSTALIATGDGEANPLCAQDLRRLVLLSHRAIKVAQEMLRREHAAQRATSQSAAL